MLNEITIKVITADDPETYAMERIRATINRAGYDVSEITYEELDNPDAPRKK